MSSGTSGGIPYRAIELSYTMTLLVPIPMKGDVVLSTQRKVALSN